MKAIYLYGTGSKAVLALPAISLHFQVLGFIDSNEEKRGQQLLSLPVWHSSDLPQLKFDEILIASSYVQEIQQQLASQGMSGRNVDDVAEVQKSANEFSNLQREYRAQLHAGIPQTPLQDMHISTARLLKNRSELMMLLPASGIGAELGVANGDFTAQILQLNQPAKLHLVDVWHSERYNETLFENVKNRFSQQLQSEQLQIHRMFSTAAAGQFPSHYFDWIYIDTTHCYQGTRDELACYADKVKPGGVIAGHDYTMGNWTGQFRYGVMEAVHEFCVKHGWRIKYLTMDLSEGQSFAIERLQ